MSTMNIGPTGTKNADGNAWIIQIIGTLRPLRFTVALRLFKFQLIVMALMLSISSFIAS